MPNSYYNAALHSAPSFIMAFTPWTICRRTRTIKVCNSTLWHEKNVPYRGNEMRKKVMKWGMWRILHSSPSKRSKVWIELSRVLFRFNYYSLASLFWNCNQAIQAEHHQLLSLLGSINWNSRSHGVLACWVVVSSYKIQNVTTKPRVFVGNTDYQ